MAADEAADAHDAGLETLYLLLMAATGAADAHDAGFVVAVDGSRRGG